MYAEKEKLLYDAYQTLLEASFGDKHPIDILNSLVVKDVMGYGTTVDEKIFGKPGVQELIHNQREQTKDLKMQLNYTPVFRRIAEDNNTAVFADDILMSISVNEETVEMQIRFSTVFEYVEGRWLLVHFHGSKPENVESEIDTFGIEEWRLKNEKLQKLIEEKTAELVEKNRELEIEAALQRVRTVAMSMSKPDDLLNIAEIVFKELQGLGFTELRNAMINIYNDAKGFFHNYDFSGGVGSSITKFPSYDCHPVIKDITRQIRNANDAFGEITLTGNGLKSWKDYRKENGELDDPRLEKCDALYYYFYSVGTSAIGISTFKPVTDNDLNILKGFRNVYNMAYQRYTDIEQAEAQAKHAQIEAALEKVRSSSLAMHHSTELEQVAGSLFDRLAELGLSFDGALIFIFDKENRNISLWIATNHLTAPVKIDLPFDKEVDNNTILKDLWNAIELGEHIINRSYSGEIKNEYFRYVAKHNGSKIPESVRRYQVEQESWTVHLVAEKNSMIGFDSWSKHPAKDEDFQILIRFAKVFEQAYTRFLDLQKAETQARDAQIEVAVERVRARALAMQQSEDLHGVVVTLKKQLFGLNIRGVTAVSMYLEQDDGSIRGLDLSGTSDGEDEGSEFKMDVFFKLEDTDPELWIRKIWNGTEKYFVVEADEADFDRIIKWLYTIDGNKAAIAEKIIKDEGIKQAWLPTVKLEKGKLNIDLLQPPTEEVKSILLKMGAAFDLAYKRFLDLQKAEAQAREAQIELALERVRARTMAMQKSDELPDTSQILFQQMKELGEPSEQLTIGIVREAEKIVEISATVHGDVLQKIYSHSIDEKYVMRKVFDAWKANQKKLVIELIGGELNAYNRYRNGLTGTEMFPTNLTDEHRRIIYVAFFSKGMLAMGVTRPRPPESLQLLERFAAVFNLTYTRFLDLQKAEAQAREAQIELGLERVRAKAMAMQSSSELSHLVDTVFKELTRLDILLDRCIIILYDEGNNDSTWWIAAPESETLPISVFVKYHELPPYLAYIDGWRNRTLKWRYLLKGDTKKQWDNFIFSETDMSLLPPNVIKGMRSFEQIFLNASFNHFGSLTVSSFEYLPDEQFDILLRFAKVFDLTYTRFNDLKQAEAMAAKAEEDLLLLKKEKKRTEEALSNLKETQKQLIQSERLASLGELTAGIAHEIQNPLNFINNFSEVSSELADELKDAVSKNDNEEAFAIAGDIRENLNKINFHGKRADSIVKGMLQHSRSSSGQKEATDINALADEYLRLSYHGLRAKDKSFNANYTHHLDDTIGLVRVVPQEIGRVLLNLFNNAFYSVGEKVKRGAEGYQPEVVLTTQRKGKEVCVRVRDNGVGIPQSVLDKIYNPFFTTKPTGEGTGLGLSMSYDIVKAHGGELRARTKEGEYAEFEIVLRTEK